MSRTKTGDNIYEIVCEGQYYSFANGQKSIRPYKLTWKADDIIKKQGFLAAFRMSLMPRDGEDSVLLRKMKSEYPDYKRFRTHIITSVVNLTKQNEPVRELQLMNRAQIVRVIDAKGLPIDCDLYPSVTDLRQALRDYRDNPVSFELTQETRRKSRGPVLAVSRSIDYLNSGEFDGTPEGKRVQKRKPVKPPVVPGGDTPAYADNESVQEELITVSDSPDDLSENLGIPEFDEQDELDDMLNDL